MQTPTIIDNQPISATFFGEGKWLTEFITPENIDVQALYHELTHGLVSIEDKIAACHAYVASEIKYKRLINGTLNIEGRVSRQNDLWSDPSTTIAIGIGNCANKSFLLTSLLRQELSADQVYCILGNLYNGKPGGHAWSQVNINGGYIVESTRADVPVLVPVECAERYEAVHYFNDEEIYYIEGRTMLEPFTACFSTWLSDYLDWAYIHGRK